MKYRLGDICTITKGETGIMKAIPGPYTMIALGETNKTHIEFQFDTKAVIIPLVSSTGHGHASMKRVKYCEGKFALGSILCAVIPKDENFVLAKYLHIYLHWNREELLVSQMKGMANVSLPMNRIADVMVTVPRIEKQREIIELEKQLVKKEVEADKLFADQLTQLENLNQAILQEAVQGKLVPQDPNDEPASELLKRIKMNRVGFQPDPNEKNIGLKPTDSRINRTGFKPRPIKELPPIKPEEIPFEIPENWVWCRLGDAGYLKRGKSKHRPRNDSRLFDGGNFPFIQTGDVSKAKNNNDLITTINGFYNEFGLAQSEIQPKGTLCITIAANIAECGFLDFDACVPDSIVCFQAIDKETEVYVYHYFKLAKADLERFAPATAQKNINLGILNDLPIPLPPLSEQKRIVAEIEKQLAKTKQLKEHIIANQQATEQLLKALLHQAFEVREVETTHN
jgi:type I restriction enzyme, S subunit